MKCSVVNCEGKFLAKGFCGKHYQKWRKYGDPLHETPLTQRHQFVLDAVANETDRCILWPYGLQNKYPRVKIDGKAWRVCHLVLVRSGQPRIGNRMAHHIPHCMHRTCINKRHLHWGTDRWDKYGQYLGGSNLTETDVAAIKADSRLQKVIAHEFGVCQSTISKIKVGRRVLTTGVT